MTSSLWIQTPEDLVDFLSYVLLYAPDHFPERSYIPPAEQMTLERAFAEISSGLEQHFEFLAPAELRPVVEELVASTLRMYSTGDEVGGAKALQRLQSLLSGT